MEDNEVKEYKADVEKEKERGDFLFIVAIIIWGIVYFLGEESSIGSILLGIWLLLASREIQLETEHEKKWRINNFLGKFVYEFLLGTIGGIALKLCGIFLMLRGIYLFFA